MSIRPAALGGAIFILSAALASVQAQERDPWPVARPLGQTVPSFKALEDRASAAIPSEVPLDRVTHDRALELSLAHNPELAALAWQVRATEGRVVQARLIPNPELGAEVENFGGSGSKRGFDGAESTLQLSQPIELGGKRGRRTEVAQIERSLAGWEYEAKRLEVYADTSKAFYELLGAQRQLALRESQLGLAERVFSAVRERVAAGRVSPLEETRARVEASSNRALLERTRRQVVAARDRLAATWGALPPLRGDAVGDLERIDPLPPLDQLLRFVPDNPLIQRSNTEYELRRSALSLEQAKRIPDVRLSAGIRRFEETRDNAFVAGISIPLPVFGTNPGGVLEAERRVPQGREEQRATIAQVTTALRQAYQELSADEAELVTLSKEILPGAEEAYEAAQTLYREGRADLLTILDSQRTLFEARSRHAEALATYHQVRLEIERLIGRTFADAGSAARERSGQ